MKQKEEIIVLDAGSNEPGIIGPDAFCCALTYTFFRG
jgi:hypothetical protein